MSAQTIPTREFAAIVSLLAAISFAELWSRQRSSARTSVPRDRLPDFAQQGTVEHGEEGDVPAVPEVVLLRAGLAPDLVAFGGHVARFSAAATRTRGWRVEKVAIAIRHTRESRRSAERAGCLAQDLDDLTAGP